MMDDKLRSQAANLRREPAKLRSQAANLRCEPAKLKRAHLSDDAPHLDLFDPLLSQSLQLRGVGRLVTDLARACGSVTWHQQRNIGKGFFFFFFFWGGGGGGEGGGRGGYNFEVIHISPWKLYMTKVRVKRIKWFLRISGYMRITT